MAPPNSINVISWLIAGLISAWLMYTIAGKGPLGTVVSGIVALEGALLGAWLIPLGFTVLAGVTADSPSWWLTIPAAFVGGLVADSLLRLVFRARRTA